jgi:cellulase/cellobiase CelA1
MRFHTWFAGYQRLDWAAGLLLKDLGKTLTVSYAHNVDATLAAGAEVSKRLEDNGPTTFVFGQATLPHSTRLCFHPMGVVIISS